MTKKCQVNFQTYQTKSEHFIGRATLNAEPSLNALTLEMINGLYDQLLSWREDTSIAVVILDGAGEKSFCAGGDIRKLHQSVLDCDHGSNPYGETFFANEYRLDYLIHTYPKPVLCWGSGIVMGGGVGLMAGASHRVVTPTSKIAMPEVSIGLFPDVGGSWILGRMPGRTGLFLGLTGTRINAHDALFVGLADRYLDDGSFPHVLNQLQDCHWNDSFCVNHSLMDQMLRDLERSEDIKRPASNIRESFDVIQSVTDASSPVEILANLHGEQGDYWEKAAKSLEQGCPLTAWLVMEQAQRARHLSLPDVFRMELNMAVHCIRGRNFSEGVRALLLERGSKPAWSPLSLIDISPEVVDECFSSLWSNGLHPLRDL